MTRFHSSFAPLRAFRSPLALFLLVCLLAGLIFRVVNLNWDEAAGLHPDERFMATLVGGIHWPSNWNEFFNSAIAPLNPDNIKDQHYVYGQIPLLLGKIVVGANGDFHQNIPKLRALSAFFDALTVLFSFFIARRLLGGRAALFAATLVSLAALHIQQSHFFVSDTFAAAFTTMAFWSGTRWLQRGKTCDWLGLSLFFGLALACKLSAVLFLIAFLGFWVLAWRKWGFKAFFAPFLTGLVLVFWVFRLGHPMAFVGQNWGGLLDLRPEKRFWEFLWQPQFHFGGDFGLQLLITRGEIDVPFNVQWIDRLDWIFPLKNLGFWGYGWPFLLSGIAGTLLILVRPRRHSILWLGALWGVILFLIQGHEFSKFTRYYLPLTPFCALGAAYFWREMRLKKPILRFGTPIVAACALFWAFCVTSIYTRRHTRLQASTWIVENLEPGTPVANETPWDEGLPLSWVPGGTGDMGFVRNPAMKIDGALDTYALDTPEKRERMLYILDNTQWIFFSSGRSWQNIPRWPRKWPMMAQFYGALWSGELGFTLQKEFTSYPRFGPLQFPDDDSEEALSVYDHPRVLLWKKNPNYNSAKARALLEAVELPTETQWKPNAPTDPLP